MEKQKSFSLIEILIGFFLIFIGMTVVFSLIIQLIASSTFYSHKLIASYLCQEGIEIIRNIRDTNLVKRTRWDEGLNIGNWEADYNDQSLSPYSGKFLNIESSGFYGYGSGSPTIFQRKISIEKSHSDILNVKVQVFWQEKGKIHKVEVAENFYNYFK